MERRVRTAGFLWAPGIIAAAVAFVCGCETPSAHTASRNYGLRGEVPVDPPGPQTASHCDDCVTGGRLFKLYCGSCHNARPLGERAFSNNEVAVAHMRDQAYLTGKEYRQIIHFLRKWHDIGPPTPPVGPSPKRFIFSQPISELREESPETDSALPPLPSVAGAASARQPFSAPPIPSH